MPVGITSHLTEQLCLSLQETFKMYLPMGKCKIHNDMFMQLHCTCIYVDALIIFHISCFNTIRVSLFLHGRSLPTGPGAADPPPLL